MKMYGEKKHRLKPGKTLISVTAIILSSCETIRLCIHYDTVGCHKSLTPCMRKSLKWCYVFCKNTNLHDFRYTSINRSSKIERLFWFVARVFAIVFCVVLMQRLWQNYARHPIATIVDKSNPIWNLSFPAVTICNNNKVYRPHADIITKSLYMNGFSTDESDKFFSSLIKLIRPDTISIDNITASQVLDNLNMTVETLMLKLMQPCSSLLVRCAWIGKIHDCNKLFKTVASKEGFCCAFNSHYSMNIFNSDTYDSKPKAVNNFAELELNSDDLLNVNEILVYGIRSQKVPGSGRDLGLTVALNIEGDMYKASSRPYIGATVLINDPIDFPDVGTHITSVKPGHVLAISVAGFFTNGIDDLRTLPPETRKCFFDNEPPGSINYSYQSCMSQCVAEYTQRLCNCLPFYYPEKHNGVRTCYLPDLNCLLNIRKSIPSYMDTCLKCLPQCTDLKYQINIENIKMDDVGYDSDITRGLNVHNISFLYVYFDDASYEEFRKESNINWDALIVARNPLASFGGIFSLCLGGSVLSVIDFIYLLVKQFLKKQRRKRPEQSLASLPPASEMFLSIPVEKIQLKRRNQQETNDKRVFVTWEQSTLQRRKTTMKLDEIHRKRGKF
ncbi:hypothetical protein DMN91_006077 [Ooceraea biroi]|uniref:Sodium channel protein Nach n=1 Tax=Ooceraea biroi TaxID=2015173 RepID=A0A3L8DMU7_OOCBI|nr:hypothetical protein DMN91_006077 [Ooceraea biroi]